MTKLEIARKAEQRLAEYLKGNDPIFWVNYASVSPGNPELHKSHRSYSRLGGEYVAVCNVHFRNRANVWLKFTEEELLADDFPRTACEKAFQGWLDYLPENRKIHEKIMARFAKARARRGVDTPI